MAHTHSHSSHAHSHSHLPGATHINRAFVVGIVLNSLFIAVETLVGFATHSLALLTDAGHNLSDVASLALALLAFRLAKVKPTETYTYGYQKTTILVALLNAGILLVAMGGIGWEAVQRFRHPEAVSGTTIALVAGIGIVINSLTAFLFFKDKDKDLNIKGAYLHLAADAAVSAGVVLAGLLMYYTQLYWLDSAISLLIAAAVVVSTGQLLKTTLRVSLDGVPPDINLPAVQQTLRSVPGVKNVHHLHIWAISTTRNALTAHLVIENHAQAKAIKDNLRHQLEHLSIHHCTFETELTSLHNNDESCQADPRRT